MDNGPVQHQESVSVPAPLQVCNHSDEIKGLLALSLQCLDVFLEGEVRIPPKPEEFRQLLHWQRCVTDPNSRGLLNPGGSWVLSPLGDWQQPSPKLTCHPQWLSWFISRGWVNIKISANQYRNSHYKDDMTSQPSYIYNVNPLPGKTVFRLRWDQYLPNTPD